MLKYNFILEKYQRSNEYFDLSCFLEKKEPYRSNKRIYQVRLSFNSLHYITGFFTNINKKNKMLKVPVLPIKILTMPNDEDNMINLIVPINQKFKDFFNVSSVDSNRYFYKFIYFHRKNELKDPLTFQFVRPM